LAIEIKAALSMQSTSCFLMDPQSFWYFLLGIIASKQKIIMLGFIAYQLSELWLKMEPITDTLEDLAEFMGGVVIGL
jgi:hypothetical protein